MGWLIGWSTRRALVEHLLKRSENERLVQEPIAKFFSGNDLWTVWEQRRKLSALEQVAMQALDNPPEEPGEVVNRFIVLFKLDGGRNKDWGYKPIEECMGPCEVSCPLKFLELAPAPAGPYGEGWRERVRAYWKARAERAKQRRERRSAWKVVA